jgi:uncharacterized OsmC-like protein
MGVNIRHNGELFCDSFLDDGRYIVITSVKTADYPCPMDLLLMAVGSCMVSYISGSVEGCIPLNTKNISCHLEKKMKERPKSKLVGVKAIVTVAGSKLLSAEDKKLIEEAAKSCPVKNSLREDIDFKIQIKYV